MKEEKDYSDIIDLPHHVSVRHPRMPMEGRAAQFGAFEPMKEHKDALARVREEAENSDAGGKRDF